VFVKPNPKKIVVFSRTAKKWECALLIFFKVAVANSTFNRPRYRYAKTRAMGEIMRSGE
jgi:hypothetical protein